MLDDTIGPIVVVDVISEGSSTEFARPSARSSTAASNNRRRIYPRVDAGTCNQIFSCLNLQQKKTSFISVALFRN